MKKVSIIWLNYNSMRFIDLALRSLRSIFDLDYEDFEVIIVDNASSDGSFEVIKEFVDKFRSGYRVKVIRSDKNRGYSGGMNLGFAHVDSNSKYVAFLNNDLVVEPQSLSAMVERIESNEGVAAASGLVFYGDGETIYSAGGVVTELGNAGGVCWMLKLSECHSASKQHYVTYADGAYTVARVDAIKEVGYLGKPFLDEAFLYFDDYILGLLLWNRGYRVVYYPVKAGLHYAHKTIKTGISYYGVRAHIALMKILRTRLTSLTNLHIMRRLAIHSELCLFGKSESCYLIRAVYDGLKLASLARKRIGQLILYRAPYVKSCLDELKCHILGLCKGLLKITHNNIMFQERDRDIYNRLQ